MLIDKSDNLNLPKNNQIMQAINISSPGPAEVLELIKAPLPKLSKDNELLIRVFASGINRPDIVQRQGLYPAPKGASIYPGLEVAGIVQEIGSGVTKYKIGDKVCALLPGGGYAEYAVAAEEATMPIPKNLNFIEAASLPETFFTVWSNIFDQGHFKANETVLIHGATSGIGVTAIQLVKNFGGNVIATASSAEKCDFAYKLGADFTINYKEQDFVEETLKYTDNLGADIILDIVGGAYVNRNYKAAAQNGRILQIAFLDGNLAQINLNYIMRKKLIHTGSTLRSQNILFKQKIAQQLHEKVWPLLEKGHIVPVIDKIFSLKDVVQAHKYMESNQHKGKIILQLI